VSGRSSDFHHQLSSALAVDELGRFMTKTWLIGGRASTESGEVAIAFVSDGHDG
jgi:hypothetical protein